jgi:small subunit ribosomal protein S16
LATTIRLTRLGKKKRPFYRLVVLDSRKRRDGAYLANLGYYNPFEEPHKVKLHDEEIIAWLQKGAQVSDTARALLRAEGVLYKYSLVKQGLSAAEIDTRMEKWREGAESRTARWQRKRDEEMRQAAEARTKAEAAAAAATTAEAEATAEAATAADADDTDAAAEAAAGSDSEAAADASEAAASDESADSDKPDES